MKMWTLWVGGVLDCGVVMDEEQSWLKCLRKFSLVKEAGNFYIVEFVVVIFYDKEEANAKLLAQVHGTRRTRGIKTASTASTKRTVNALCR